MSDIGVPLYIKGKKGELDGICHLLECPECKRKILVSVGLIGINHTISIVATCADCLKIKPSFAIEYPEIVEKIEEWRSKEKEVVSDLRCQDNLGEETRPSNA
jgi:hypothetical protein